MATNIRIIYSPNFNPKKRKKSNIKFLIFHYTGMKSEKDSIKRLTQIQSEVGTHYYIKKYGEIIKMIPELYTAWHAGISQWGKYRSINKYSIGIEISNPGHQFGYVNFSKKQIKSLIKLTRVLVKKYRIKKNHILGHSDIAPNRKKDPGEKFPWKVLYKNKIGIWHNLNNERLISLRRKSVSFKELTLFMKNLKKFGYSNKSISVKNQLINNKILIKAFQRRFRPELINGNIDKECLLIMNKIASIKA